MWTILKKTIYKESKDTENLKIINRKSITCNYQGKTYSIVISLVYKIEFKSENITRDKEGNLIMTKE